MSPDVYSCMRITVIFVALTMFIGCGSTPPTRYYQLHATTDQDFESYRGNGTRTIVGVGPVEIPSYVDRDQMVIRAGEAEVELLEFDRWAEPLEQNLTRVLVANLSQLVKSHGATVLRWDEGFPLDYHIRIEFTQFDFSKSGEVSLVARWFIVGKDGQEARIIETSQFTGSGIPEDYASLVSEMSRHVESLSREVADTVTSRL